MKSLVDRLLEVPFVGFVYEGLEGVEDPSVCREAAARIAKLEAALKDILFWTEDCGPHAEQIERIVHAALEGNGDAARIAKLEEAGLALANAAAFSIAGRDLKREIDQMFAAIRGALEGKGTEDAYQRGYREGLKKAAAYMDGEDELYGDSIRALIPEGK